MKFTKSKSVISIAISLLVLTGCGANLSNLVPTEIPSTSGNNSKPDNPTGNSNFGGLKFSQISDKNIQLLNSASGGNFGSDTVQSTGSTSAATESASLAAPQASKAMVADESIARYPGGFPSPGQFERYIITDTEEAKSKGFTGTYLNTVRDIIIPISKGLSSDARLVSSSGSSDENGLNKPVEPQKEKSVYSPYKWHFSYTSKAKLEAYNIYVSSKETLVIRQKWGLINLDLNEVKIDTIKAIEIVTDAIKNKNYQPPNKRHTNNNSRTSQEIIYDIPKGASWHFYLNQDKKDLVWNLNLNYNYRKNMPEPVILEEQEVDSNQGKLVRINTWYSNAYARVNAKTGEILSLSRPVKNTYKYYSKPVQSKTEPANPLSVPTATSVISAPTEKLK